MLDLVGNFTFFDQVDARYRLVMLSIEEGTLGLVDLFQQVEELLKLHV